MQDVRWKQRFNNFERAFALLENSLTIESPDMTQKAGIIQFFEMCYELSWKMLKDYLIDQGYIEVNSPRSAIKKSFAAGLIEDGHSWMQLIEDRNLTAHTYDEEKASKVESMIHEKYAPLFKSLYDSFQSKMKNE